MYPHATKLELPYHPMLIVGENVVPPEGEGDYVITVELESDGGTGDVEVDIRTETLSASLRIKPDDALTLAETLTMYANASKRIEARKRAMLEG